MLKVHGEYILPDNVPANEFLNLEGDKISTSRNWAVWLHEYLDEFRDKQDVLRYVLCATMPEAKDNDFTWKDFQSRNNNELVAILGNFVNRTLVLTQKYYNGLVPGQGILNDSDRKTLEEIGRIKQAVEDNLDNFRFREALKAGMDLARLGNKYLTDTEPWKLIKTDPERVQTIMYISLQITATLSLLLEPFIPFSMRTLRDWLKIGEFGWNDAGRNDLLTPGHTILNPGLLFEKIEDDQIEKQISKLMQTKIDNAAAAAVVAPGKDPVTFDDFTKVDLRTATILEAEKVPKTTKLMKLKVDTGLDIRTIVSGIAEHYTAEELPGLQVSVIVNLEPRTIKGIESKGMILLAEETDGKLVFVSPVRKTENGSVIK